MPVYECRAVDGDGRMTLISLEADSRGSAAADVRARGLTLISVEEVEDTGTLGLFSLRGYLPVGTKEKILLFRMLATLVNSEITVTQAIRVLHEQADKANMKRLLADIRAGVEGGAPVSDALARHPRVFSPLMVNMVRAGEMGGILEVVFNRIADFMERRANLRKKLFMTFFYPGIVLLAGIGVILFMVLFVIPRFMGLIRGKLPPVTQFLMDSTNFLQDNGQSILTGIGAAAGLLLLLHALPVTRYYMDRYKMNLPVIGHVFRLGVVVAFARTFGLLLESRIPLVEALRATSGTISNTAVQKLLGDAVNRVLAGDPLSSTLTDTWAFTPITRSLVSIGEYSGLMSESMVTVAEMHETILEDKIARMSAMVEPALILTLGVLVGIVVYGLISGMLAMYAGAL
jgi:type IV pilus assembly protein PilC